MDYTNYVNIRQGTASEARFSTGNTLPPVCEPFGMNSFCLQTKGSRQGRDSQALARCSRE